MSTSILMYFFDWKVDTSKRVISNCKDSFLDSLIQERHTDFISIYCSNMQLKSSVMQNSDVFYLYLVIMSPMLSYFLLKRMHLKNLPVVKTLHSNLI